MMKKKNTTLALLALSLCAHTACGQATENEPEPDEDTIVLIEDDESEGGGEEPGGGCPEGSFETTPPGFDKGCYTDCQESTSACSSQEECRTFNGGAIAICLPVADEPDTGGEPADQPACEDDEALINLPYRNDPVCLKTCELGDAARGCTTTETCYPRAVTGSEGVCTPNARVVSTDSVVVSSRDYGVVVDSSNTVWLFYVSPDNHSVNMMTKSPSRAFTSPEVLVQGEDSASTENIFGNIRVAAGDNGRVGLMWYSLTREGVFPNSYFGHTKYHASFGPGADSGLAVFYEMWTDTDSDTNHNFDVSFTKGTDFRWAMANPRNTHFYYGGPSVSGTRLWVPDNKLRDVHLETDSAGAGHLFYLDGFNGSIYQFVTPAGEGSQQNNYKLADLEDDKPAAIASAMSPEGEVFVLETFWRNGSSRFSHSSTKQPNKKHTFEQTWLDFFGAHPLDIDLTYSTLMGPVACGGTSRGLECYGTRLFPRNLERVLVSDSARTQSNGEYVTSYSNVQVTSGPDGAVHVFWLTPFGDDQTINHAVIR